MKRLAFAAGLLLAVLAGLYARAATPAPPSAPWVPDLGNGTYKNPIIYADYSDPDVVRVGKDFYLVSSSFTCAPGIPVLHSNDLVNWTIINHALPRQVPADVFNKVQNGKGVWAPSIRFHDGKYYIFYPDPDFGIYMVSATDPAGAWSPPTLVLAGKGLEDPCPLWDGDGKVYLVNAWVGSRGASPNRLSLTSLSPDASKALDTGKDLILGKDFKVTALEGPKFYKLNGYYYIFAPVGGVGHGTQAVFRAKNIAGPYEYRSVLAQGATDVNGPHQGGLVDTPNGQWWFIHFQDQGPYGRVDHLEPVTWKDGWPQMGENITADGLGQPVLTHQKPDVGQTYPIAVPQTSDEFNSPALGLQWQWQANPDPAWFSLTANPGHLRLFAQPWSGNASLQAALLLQKFPAPSFQVTTRLDFSNAFAGEQAGLIILADPALRLGLVKTPDGLRLSETVCPYKPKTDETEAAGVAVTNSTIYLRVAVSPGAKCQFSYSTDGSSFTPLGVPVNVAMVRNSWIGAKFGLYSFAPANSAKSGFADYDWIHVEPLASPLAALPDIPRTSDVVRYEQDFPVSQSKTIPKDQGDAVLSALDSGQGIQKPYFPPGMIVDFVAPRYGLNLTLTNGGTYNIGLGNGCVYLPEGIYDVKDSARAKFDQAIGQLDEAARQEKVELQKQIVSAPRPLVYVVGTVDDGGTLSSLARMFYGDAAQWKEIYEANRLTIKDPNVISGGMKLIIPK